MTATEVTTAETVEVTKAQFFAFMGPRDVHPRPTRDCSVWETPSRQVLGYSMPGYMGASGQKPTYTLTRVAFESMGATK
ncbi:hypothetical protein D3C87_1805020 [compost metagenome]|jgi:hypothetical protein